MSEAKFVFAIFFGFSISVSAIAQERKFAKHENVVYGMISGMALLMDIYEPKNGNNIGIVCIPGSGFGYFSSYQKIFNHTPLKDDYSIDKKYGSKWMQSLVDAGYTVFVINHRFSPRFQYPDAVEDARRAVRFIRYNATKYHINPAKIGAIGQSSGGYLAAMLGVYDEQYSNPNNVPIDAVSSKVQVVITMAAPFILSDFNRKEDTRISSSLDLRIILGFMGELPQIQDGDFALMGKFADASPINHISKEDAPMLIYHSEDDPMIPVRQATSMYEKLVMHGVESEIEIHKGEGHKPMPVAKKVDAWFAKFLGGGK